jgi:hypothetical protein
MSAGDAERHLGSLVERCVSAGGVSEVSDIDAARRDDPSNGATTFLKIIIAWY